MSRIGSLLFLSLFVAAGGRAQTFNPANKYLVSGLGYAFTPVADTGMSRVRIQLKTLDVFQKKLQGRSGAAAGALKGIDTLFRASAFEACLQEINQSPMVGGAFRNDSTRILFRKDRFHATAGIYDTAGGNLLTFLWCQGLTWTMQLKIPLEKAEPTARLIDRLPFYASIANWGFISGNVAPLAFSTDMSFQPGTETFWVPENQSQPIRFSLREVWPQSTLPDVSFDYATEAAAYLKGREPQKLPTTAGKNNISQTTERMPSFKGNLMRYIAGKMEYPEAMRAGNVEGILVMRFVVTETGAVTDIEVERGTGHEMLDREGIRILEQMPSWEPAMQRDAQGNMQPVKVYFRLPVSFTLN